MSAVHQVCTFLVDGYLIGLSTGHVREVLRSQNITRVPLAPPAVSGLINLRGEIVTAIDLRLRLDLEPPAEDRPPMNVVVHKNGAMVSLLVDEIGEVIEVPEEAYEPAPEHLGGVWRDLIRGAFKLPDRLLLMLDLARAIDLNQATGGGQSAHTAPVALPHMEHR